MPQQGLPDGPVSVESAVKSAVDKLIDASKVMQHRMGLKPVEQKRVNDAFTLLASGLPAESKGAKQRELYLDFLRRVRTVLGTPGVVLCAVGLGPAAVANMRDRVRVDLPFKMKERWDEFESGVLQRLADDYSAKNALRQEEVTSYDPDTQIQAQFHTGDVYELTIDDARTVTGAMSNHIRGKIWLTDSYGSTASFLTIPISEELTNQFTAQRLRVM